MNAIIPNLGCQSNFYTKGDVTPAACFGLLGGFQNGDKTMYAYLSNLLRYQSSAVTYLVTEVLRSDAENIQAQGGLL